MKRRSAALVMAGTLFALSAAGELGAGMRWFVYDGEGIDSCADGVLWFLHDGERYEYRTPIPGCTG